MGAYRDTEGRVPGFHFLNDYRKWESDYRKRRPRIIDALDHGLLERKTDKIYGWCGGSFWVCVVVAFFAHSVVVHQEFALSARFLAADVRLGALSIMATAVVVAVLTRCFAFSYWERRARRLDMPSEYRRAASYINAGYPA